MIDFRFSLGLNQTKTGYLKKRTTSKTCCFFFRIPRTVNQTNTVGSGLGRFKFSIVGRDRNLHIPTHNNIISQFFEPHATTNQHICHATIANTSINNKYSIEDCIVIYFTQQVTEDTYFLDNMMFVWYKCSFNYKNEQRTKDERTNIWA